MADELLASKSDYDKFNLRHFVQKNDLEGVRYKILEKGADVNSKDGKSYTPIHLAAKYSSPEILKLLIEAGADVNFKDARSYTAIHVAAKFSCPEIVKLLIEAGADVNVRNSVNGQTPIFLANDARIAKILVEAGAEVNVQDMNYYQPVHYFVREKNGLSIIEYLVNCCGADVDQRSDFFGHTPLDFASNYDYLKFVVGLDQKLILDLIKFLMKNKADVNNINSNRRTPLVNLLSYRRKPLDPEFIKIFRFVLRYSDISVNEFIINNVNGFNPKLCEILLEHAVVLLSLGTATFKSHEDLIKNCRVADLRVHFKKCKNEFLKAKMTKIGESWITFDNLLTDDKRRLKNYAGNKDLVKAFKGTDLTSEFPVYGKEMMEKMEKGIRIRKLYDESCGLFSNHIPILGPNHLIVRDVLDCLTCSTKNLAKFCTK